ncbi:bacteriocin class II family protein [Streptococcus sp.]|jgi:bacteriocin-like protein|uniref:bacteriocin class II family protein n=1 Tax=Streptococcus sp. TaxID=1306 RepID=UPI0017AC082E|nr:bacteriocin class II family protein [Streptococcus sp.]HHU66039.1 ComC/BlpC family peptide pheromone/bacteriocin [Streptococcus sp.]
MNTKTFEQFDVMTEAELSTVEGGGLVKCGLGTVGGALTGGVAGAAVGTVTLPIFGTVSGTAAGFWGGAATGAATFC